MHTIEVWVGHGSEKMVERYTHHRTEYHQHTLRRFRERSFLVQLVQWLKSEQP